MFQFNREEMTEKINDLKKKKGYTILGHNYLASDIIDICDITGDSLALAKKAVEISSDKILFIGVDFMAETIKILNPNKKIIVPTSGATCPMANSLDKETLLKFKEKYPSAPVVLYVNSRAECKKYADYACTSANAVDVVKKIDSDTILFGPDKNLASYVAQKTGKNIIPIPGESGYCCLHNRISVKDIKEVKAKYNNAKVIVHPECPADVRDSSDYIGSTAQMYDFPQKDETKDFIIGTEVAMIYQLQKAFPDRNFYPLNEQAQCGNMKKNNLKNVYLALEEDRYEVILDDEIMEKSYSCINSMFELMKK